MKTFRSKRYGFEIEIPNSWVCPPTGFLGRLFGLDRDINFKGSSEFFNIRVNPLVSEPSLPEVETSFINHSLRVGHTSIETGSIRVGGKDHFWTRYMMGERFVLQILEGLTKLEPAGFEIIKYMKNYYRRELGLLSNTNEFIKDDIEKGIGPVLKKYYLIFNQIEYNITCAIGYGTISEVKEEFKEEESNYDKIVSTFRLVHR